MLRFFRRARAHHLPSPQPFLARLGFERNFQGCFHPSEAFKRLAVMLMLSLGVSIGEATTVSATAQPGSCTWHADASSLYQVQADTNAVSQSISLKNTVALAMNGTDCGVWAIAGNQLYKFDRLAQKTMQVALASLDAKLDGANLTAVDPVNDAVWIANGKALVNVGANGQVVVSVTVPGTVRAIGIGLDRSIWVLGNKQLWQYSSQGELVGSRDLHDIVTAIPKLIAVDTQGNTLWLAGEKKLTRIELNLSSQSVLNIDLPHQVSALALNPLRGELWLSTQNDQLLGYGRDGSALYTIDLRALNLRNVVALAFDPIAQSLWTASRDALGRFSVNGDFAARLTGRDGSAGIAAPAFTLKPALALVRPPQNALTNDPQPTIAYSYDAVCNGQPCTVTPDHFTGYNLTATLNQNPIAPFAFDAASGQASYTPGSRLPEGLNILSAQVKDGFGNLSDIANDQFTIDTIPPKFLSVTPESGAIFTVPQVNLQGEIDDINATVVLDGSGTSANTNVIGSTLYFSFPVTLALGQNGFNLSAIDKAGNTSSHSISLIFSPPPPPSPVAASVALGKLTNGAVVLTGQPGAVGVGLQVAVINTRSQETFVTSADSTGGFTISIAAKGGDILAVSAVNQWGLASPSIQLTVASASSIPIDPNSEPGIVPPDPAAFATPLDPTVPTRLASSTAFLYTGPNAIQTGVAPGTIESRRVAVIRGRVIDRDGNSLPAVRVRVLHHPEFGQTYSRADGAFDLVVNGGGLLTLTYDKSGLLPAQRQVQTPWQDFVSAPDVAMVALDEKVDTIVLGAAAPMQVAQGKLVTDQDGARQATILFPSGTSATMHLPDGSTQTLTTINVRATEYTVGPNGPKAMPGMLPPTSGYTYAVELSVDEAITAGATTVSFSNPVPVYVDNFLDFPVGAVVPAGYYDRAKAAWIPSNNGRVIKILSVTNGMADLDIKGDGAVADVPALAALGITDVEREKLAALYAAGKSLWRVAVSHFTPWDCNWPFGPPKDAETPSGCDENGNCTGPEQEKEDDPNEECGSIIECENQVVGERVPITGTPFTLNYRSNRVPGYTATRTIRVPLSDASVPASLERIDLVISVAGRKITQSFPAQSGQTYEFVWDGKDVYGRDVIGKFPVGIYIGYVYKGIYYPGREDLDKSFAMIPNAQFQRNIERGEITIYRTAQVMLSTEGGAALQGVGGWTVDVNHMYDSAEGGSLLLGDGSTRKSKIQGITAAKSNLFANGIVLDAAGNIFYSGLGISKIATNGNITQVSNPFYRPVHLAVDHLGNLYTAVPFFSNMTLIKIAPDGTETSLAGNGPSIPTALKQAIRPAALVVDRDGTIYFSEHTAIQGNFFVQRCYVKKMSPDGAISIVGGDGSCFKGYAGDNGLALHASFVRPTSLALDSQGNLYVADNSVVRKISTDGTITTVAGNKSAHFSFCPSSASSADGTPAADVCLGTVTGIAIDNTDNLLIASEEFYGHRRSRIRKVKSDGTVTTVASSSMANCVQGSSVTLSQVGPAQSVCSSDSFSAIAVNAKNEIIAALGSSIVIVGDSQTRCVGLQGQFALDCEGAQTYVGETFYASEDASQLYVISADGKHVRTVNAKTKAAIYQFGYDESGRLQTIQDGDSNVTTITRDASGAPISIISPYGQRTELSVDANGYLASVTNPNGETTAMAYSSSGLLTRFESPKKSASTFSYDQSGRLTRDQNAANGYWQISRLDLGNNSSEVSMTTAMGRTKTHRTEATADGGKRRVSIFEDGSSIQTLVGAGGTTTTTESNGTVTTEIEGPDPRFGMLAPFVRALSIKLPSGLTYNKTVSRTASLNTANDPFSLLTETEMHVINGKQFKSEYDAIKRQFTITTPMNRQTVVKTDALGRMLLEQVSGIQPLNYSYDSRGRLASTTQGSGADERTVHYAYNAAGYLESVTDALGRITRYGYDAAGRVKTVTTPDSRVIGFDYDANGNLVSVTPPSRPSHGFDYNEVDLSTGYTPPALGTTPVATRYEYNLDKDLIKVTRPDGQTIEYGYDAGGRLATLTTPNGVTNYGYKAGSGQLASIVTPDGNGLSYGYDGALPTTTGFAGPVAGTISSAYDSFFRLSQLGVNGSNVAFGYDNDGLLIAAGSLALARDATNGLVTGTTLGQITTSQSYDGFGQLASFTARQGATVLYDEQYARDKLGRVIQKTTTVDGQTSTSTYAYDTAGRIVDVTKDGSPAGHFEYDANGNRTLAYGIDASYDEQDRLIQFGGAQYSHTANGELKQVVAGSSVTDYEYDVFGNLNRVTLPGGGTIDYLVDGRHRRIGKKVNGSLTQGFLYQDQLKPAAELDGQGNVVARFVYAGKANVPEYMVKGGVTYRIITDQLGSVRLVVDSATGQVVQWIDYDDWGNVISDSNPGFQPFGFAGGLYDRDTGLTRFGARDYDARTARWTAKDPIGFNGGDTGLFNYVGNDPINRADPLGLSGDFKPWGNWGDINSRPGPTDQSGRVPQGPVATEGPYNAPERKVDKIADRIVDRLVKEATGIGGIITGSKWSIIVSGMTFSEGLNKNEAEELRERDLKAFCRGGR